MARPAKPPMTLREAKRAHKKDGGHFQYTATQMARADRQDAREEQRKKAIEKEKQRQENKRKRDEKLERERSVKRKMLEEGRITVEDTWGKVTASQPRLNSFFVQRPVRVPAKRSIQDETIHQEDTVTGNKSHGQKQAEDGGVSEQEELPEDVDNIVSAARSVDVTNVEKKASPSQSLSASFPSLSRILYPTSRLSRSQGEDERQQSQGQPSALRELSKSQLNMQSRSKVPRRPSQVTEGKYDLCCSSPRSQKTSQGAPQLPQLPVEPLKQVTEPLHSSSTSKSVSSGTYTSRGPDDQGISEALKEANGSAAESVYKLEPCRTMTPTSSLPMDEEAITDGIDDGTLLLPCSMQTPPRAVSTKQTRPVRAPFECHPAGTPVESTSSPSKEKRERSRHETGARMDEATRPPPTVNESFSAVFNEIEDEDLIALAEKLEANNATPPNHIHSSLKPAFMKTAPIGEPESKTLPEPVAQPIRKRKSEGSLTSEDSRQEKTREVLPGEDFDELGPSTQALMLELVQQAEAAMGV